MIFKKRNAGSMLEKSYIWTANSKDHKIVIHFNNEKFFYWFTAVKDEMIVYNSLDDELSYDSFEEAVKNIETWVELNIKPRKTKYTVQQKYLKVLNTLKKIIKENPNSQVSKEIQVLLRGIREI